MELNDKNVKNGLNMYGKAFYTRNYDSCGVMYCLLRELGFTKEELDKAREDFVQGIK